MSSEWFQRAIFYEVMVRSFADSDGDGVGDLAGLTDRLDYLAWLGVDCLWLPPFFPSPLADGGYDVSDYRGVLPQLGTLDDFDRLIARAHARGLRVIIDVVMNHTSSAHPWFQASRTDPDGPYGDWYVWSDTDEPYADARIIFLDTETSNWTWDPVRRQFYWHRFYSHQPDLNFANPAVLAEMLDSLRFWLDRGVDGFRLDAVPYLVEQDETNCENLPGTHDILRQVRAMVDREYPGRILLCEANQWPADVVEYFGDSDECQLAFHFPVMPRLYLALHEGSAASVRQILADTPPIPAGCQWATFLRNHDELTLEMVTPRDRELLWDAYAPVPRMRSNLGIRRRLAPLVDGDPARIRLLHALLLALPGSPVLYYGDEIGMGDEIHLPDRDGVRTPMQWDATATAGFSTASPDAFALPLVSTPGYTPSEVNVADQADDPSSLLTWVRTALAVRRRLDVFGTGSFRDLTDDDRVLVIERETDERRVWVAANLSTDRVTVPAPAGEVALASDGAVLDAGSLTLDAHGFAWIATAP